VTESEATIALAARYGLFILSLDPEAFIKDTAP